MFNFNLVFEATTGQQLVELTIQYFDEELLGHLTTLSLGVLMIVGSLLMLLAAVGLMRLPDLPTRMHASTKAGSLGAALIMLGAAVAMPEPQVLARVFAVIAFLLLTAPVAAHVIGRAGYFMGVPLWKNTVKDDLADQYDYDRHSLRSGDFANRKIEGFTDVPEGEEAYQAFDPADTARREGDVFKVDNAPTAGPSFPDDSDAKDRDVKGSGSDIDEDDTVKEQSDDADDTDEPDQETPLEQQDGQTQELKDDGEDKKNKDAEDESDNAPVGGKDSDSEDSEDEADDDAQVDGKDSDSEDSEDEADDDAQVDGEDSEDLEESTPKKKAKSDELKKDAEPEGV